MQPRKTAEWARRLLTLLFGPPLRPAKFDSREGKVAELVVLGIDNAYDAGRILAEMNRMDVERAHAPAREDDVAGLLVMNPSMHSSHDGRLRADVDISESLSDCGIEDGFVHSLTEMLEAESSALFLVVRESQTGKVLEELSGFPGRVLRSCLSVDQIPHVQRALSRVGMSPA